MFSWKILLTTLIFLFYFDCNSVKNNNLTENISQNVKTDGDEVPNDLLITLERTACYGTCPAYKLSVKSDGIVSFEGVSNTKVKGKIEEKISIEKVRQLIKEFEIANYFNLNGKFDSKNCYQWTDNPSTLTSIQINGEKKNIDHYQGCREGDDDFKKKLSKLTELENKTDEIVETKRWIGEGK